MATVPPAKSAPAEATNDRLDNFRSVTISLSCKERGDLCVSGPAFSFVLMISLLWRIPLQARADSTKTAGSKEFRVARQFVGCRPAGARGLDEKRGTLRKWNKKNSQGLNSGLIIANLAAPFDKLGQA